MGLSTGTSKDLAHILTLKNNTNPVWYRDAGLRQLNIALLVLFIFQATGGFDETAVGGFQASAAWLETMGTSDSYLLGLTSSILFAGELVMVLPGAYLADRYGRRLPLFLGSGIQVISAIMNSCAQGFALFTVSRAFMGVGIGLFLAAAPVLTQELPHPRHREILSGQFNGAWYVGSIVASAILYGTTPMPNNWSWRIPTIIQAIPGLICFVGCFWVPESPRWLVGMGRNDEALAILAKYHANGDENDELVQFEFAEIKEVIEQEKSFIGISWWTLFRGPANRKRTALLVLAQAANQMNGQGVIAYYSIQIFNAIGITSVNEQTGQNLGLSVGCLLACWAGGWAVGRYPQRWIWFASVGGMLLSNVPFIISYWHFSKSGDTTSANSTLFFIWTYSLTCNFGMSPLIFKFSAEILPFNLRAIGTGFSQLVACSLLLTLNYVNPIGINNAGWKFYTFYTGCLVIILTCVILYLPETFGRSLEQITAVFEPKIHLNDPEQFHKEHATSEDDVKPASSDDKNGDLVATEVLPVIH